MPVDHKIVCCGDNEKLNRLRRYLDDLNKEKQSLNLEIEIFKINMEISMTESRINYYIAKRAAFFVDTWRKFGTFTAIREDGTKKVPNLEDAGTGIQKFWNVRNEAMKLARWSIGSNGD